MVDFFMNDNRRDEVLAKKAHPNGDIDLLISPVDGKLVMVAQIFGVHVCATCAPSEGPVTAQMQFVNDPAHKQRPVEWNPPDGQGTRLLIHAGCVGREKKQGGSSFVDLVRGHQLKRFTTQNLLGGIKGLLRG